MKRYCLFKPIELVATPGALGVLERAGVEPVSLFLRHVCGDWGEMTPEEERENVIALFTGQRVYSVFNVDGQDVWYVTDPTRSRTTIILPEEY